MPAKAVWIVVGDIHENLSRLPGIPELAEARGIIVNGDFTNYGGIISVGSLSGEDGTPLSIGMFGKVFTTFSEDQAYDYINGLIDETDIENIIKNLNKENYGNQNTESDEGE